MTVKFDTRGIPVADREEVVRAPVSRTLAPLEIDFMADRGPAATRLAITDLTELTVWSVTSTANKVHYKALPRDDVRPSLFLGLQRTGSCVVAQRDREITLRPGDLAVWDSTNPFIITDADGISQHKFRIPLDRLALPIDVNTGLAPRNCHTGDSIRNRIRALIRLKWTRGVGGVRVPPIH